MFYNLLRRLEDLVYYWELDERPRKQYIHVLRNLKDDLYNSLEENVLFRKIYYLIPSDIKQDDIEKCIVSIKQSLEK